MKKYLDLLWKVKEYGIEKSDRTGTGTRSLFGEHIKIDLQKGFPICTTKFVSFKSVAHELLWFLSGDTNIKYLNDNKVTIWDEWADENGDLGPIYGEQWTNWNGVNQIQELIIGLKNNPDSRRHIISAWNIGDLPIEAYSPQHNVSLYRMALAPCHCFFQCYVANGKLSLHLYQRSADAGIGIPYNIASYALLTHMIAQQCDLIPDKLIISYGDIHIYNNHLEQIELQLSRESKKYPLPTINIRKADSIFDYKIDDFELINYKYHPPIKMPIAV